MQFRKYLIIIFFYFSSQVYASNFSILGQGFYGATAFDSGLSSNFGGSLSGLWQIPESEFVLGIGTSYVYGKNADVVQDGDTFSKEYQIATINILAGVRIDVSKTIYNLVLVSFTHSYYGRSKSTSTTTQDNTSNTFTMFSFGLQNNLMYRITSNFGAGIYSAISINTSNLQDKPTQTSASPALGITLEYKL